jgi:hypothetical protein
VGNYNYSQGRSFLTGNEENPALLLSNVHNRTSARDGPMFGSMGHSMNTSSLMLLVLFFIMGSPVWRMDLENGLQELFAER